MKFLQLKFWLILITAAFCAACGSGEATNATNSSNNSSNAAPANTPEANAASSPSNAAPANAAAKRELDVPYVPTHESIVDEMLRMADVKADDVLYDLGSGDGRIPITAAKRFGTRGVGIDIDPQRIKEANENAKKVKFIEGDIFQEDFSEATVLTLYLLPDVNLKLRPKILEMKPGTRVVSHNYDMGDWKPEQTKTLTTPDGSQHYVYLWRVPEKK
jgi:hypothetical protein